MNLEEQVKTLRTEITEEEKQMKKMSRDIQVKTSNVLIVVKIVIHTKIIVLPILEMAARSSQACVGI